MDQHQEQKKIFIVDDDKDLLNMYSVKFKESNFEVTEAFGSTEALERLRGGITPDVVVLDVVMPNMDGFELLSIIKSENLAAGSKVVMLSNLGQQSDVERGRSLGAHGYIIKASATPAEVVEKICIVLDGGVTFAEID
jgi:DNA-binding response OmpR family regulator